MIKQTIAESDILRAQLSVLLVKNEIEYKTPFSKIQQLLLERFNVEYSFDEIEDELIMMDYEDNLPEYEEDYFESY